MDMASELIASMVFKPVLRGGYGKMYLDGRMLTVLMMLDGKKTTGEVARESGISLADVRRALTKLISLRLVESVERAISIVDQDFFDFLVHRMSMAIGPLGEILVEDSLEELGFNKHNFPSMRTAELVDLLSQEIKRSDKRLEFKRIMHSKILEKGLMN